jgi:hypothetical protein
VNCRFIEVGGNTFHSVSHINVTNQSRASESVQIFLIKKMAGSKEDSSVYNIKNLAVGNNGK